MGSFEKEMCFVSFSLDMMKNQKIDCRSKVKRIVALIRADLRWFEWKTNDAAL